MTTPTPSLPESVASEHQYLVTREAQLRYRWEQYRDRGALVEANALLARIRILEGRA